MNDKKDKAFLIVNRAIIIINDDPKIKLSQLAKNLALSSGYLQRTFKAIVGISPKEYAYSLQTNSFKENLLKFDSITEAIYGAGFESNSRIYEHSNKLLGMTPSEYKKGYYSGVIMLAVAKCSLGSVLVAQTDKGICAIDLGDCPDTLLIDIQKRFPDANFIGGDKDFEKTIAKVIGFIENPKSDILKKLPLDLQGTVFQKKVWNILRNVPISTTVTYEQLAVMAGYPKAVRAVASACAKNTVALAVPCHRVVRKNGQLGGYRWGVEKKKLLLQKEQDLL